MYKINSFYPIFIAWLIIFFIAFNSFSQDAKPVIAVLGLDNEGGISETVIDTICARISVSIETIQSHYVFQREFIPPVLEESGFVIKNGTYSRKEELAKAGILLSADEIIGGSISRQDGNLTLILKRIDVRSRDELSIQKLSTNLSKQEFLDLQLPELVNGLLTSGNKNITGVSTQTDNNQINTSNVENIAQNAIDSAGISNSIEPRNSLESDKDTKKSVINKKRKRKAPLWIAISGVAIAGAATGAYLYFERGKTDGSDPQEDVSLYPLPDRIKDQ